MWLCKRLNNIEKWDCDRLTEDADFGKKNHLEAHFDLVGAQKTRMHTLKSRRTKNESMFGGDFGPEGVVQRVTVTVNGDHYWVIFKEFLFAKMMFQQDDATCLTAEATRDVLRLVCKDALSAAKLMPFGYLRVAI